MKIRLLFNVNFVLIGRHIHLFAIACMGSKRHMLLSIFNDYSMPFYKFGDILFFTKK